MGECSVPARVWTTVDGGSDDGSIKSPQGVVFIEIPELSLSTCAVHVFMDAHTCAHARRTERRVLGCSLYHLALFL